MRWEGWTTWMSWGGRAGLSGWAGLHGRVGQGVRIFTVMTGGGRTCIRRVGLGVKIFTVMTGGGHTWIRLASAGEQVFGTRNLDLRRTPHRSSSDDLVEFLAAEPSSFAHLIG